MASHQGYWTEEMKQEAQLKVRKPSDALLASIATHLSDYVNHVDHRVDNASSAVQI